MARHAKLSDDGGAGDHHFGGIPSSPVHNERHTYRTSSRRHGYFRHSMTFLGGFLLGIYGAFVFRNDLLTGPASPRPSREMILDLEEKPHTMPPPPLPTCPPCAKCEKCQQCPKCPPPPKPCDKTVTDASADTGAPPSGATEMTTLFQSLDETAGLEFHGVVDGKRAFSEFLPFVPEKIQSKVSDHAMVFMTKGSGFLPLRSPSSADGTFPFEDLQACKEVNVIALARERCYVAVNTQMSQSSFHVHRYSPVAPEPAEGKEGGMEEAKEDKQAGEEEEALRPPSWRLKPRISLEGSRPPKMTHMRSQEGFLLELFSNLPDLEEKAGALFARAADSEKRLLIMALNEGDVDLLVNFVCSARQASISVENLVVISADQSVVDIAEALHLHAFSHPGFGTLPSERSGRYGDENFQVMMWLKVVSVWIAIRLGYHVLFQDADLVWLKSPWEAFADTSIDGFFMDDGARSERFAPLYANSGFYFLRSNPIVTHFMQGLLLSYDSIRQCASHQTVFIREITEHMSRSGMKVKVLPDRDFPQGQVFHHQKAFMREITARNHTPYVFHMCWTKDKPDKIMYLIKSNMWYMTSPCNSSDAMLKTQKEGQISLATCCLDPRASISADSR